MFVWLFFYFKLRLLPLVLSLAATKRPGSIFLGPFRQVFIHIGKIPLSLPEMPEALLEAFLALSAFPCMAEAPVQLSPLWPFTGLAPECLCLLRPGEPRAGPSGPGVASPVLSRGEGSLP